jgi:acyl-CoA reductase-like NAD-dependent aldehyde dehydrogenase
VSLELGGKDPAIVLEDADLDRAAAGITNWALHNTGQNCGSIERVYVVAAVADALVERLKSAFSRLRTGPADDPKQVDVSPLNNPQQLAKVELAVADAVAKGAKVLTGGTREGMKGLGYPPTLLDHCNHEMMTLRDETFGPVLPIVRVKDAEEAVRLANDSRYGLNASVWSRDLRRAQALGRRLQAGSIFVNNHAISGAMPACPWSGVKESGYGVANSVLALDVFTRPRTMFVDKSANCDPFWFPVDADLWRMGSDAVDLQLSPLKVVLNPFRLLGFLMANLRRPKTVLNFFRKR